MKKWHETLAANIALRIGGALLIALSWSIAVRLRHMVSAGAASDATSLALLLSALAFLAASMGCALLFVGGGLWATVEVSERWRPCARRHPPERRDRDGEI